MKCTAFAKSVSNRNGRSTTEVLVVFLLFIVLGLTVFALAFSGSNAWKQMDVSREIMSNTRIAISFVQTKIRQNDVLGALRLDENPLGEGNALVITEVIQDAVYETWIFHADGILREALILYGEPVTEDVSFDIVSLDGFVLDVDDKGKGIHLSAWGTDKDGKQLRLSSYSAVRSGGIRK